MAIWHLYHEIHNIGVQGGMKVVSGEKVKLMTRAAIYEKKEKKGNLRINGFRQEDYIAWNMIKALVGITAGYILVIGIYALYGSETMLDQLTLEYLFALGKKFLAGYCIVLLFTGVISYVVYFLRYLRAKKENRAYIQYLKKIKRIYQKEGGTAENAKEEPLL